MSRGDRRLMATKVSVWGLVAVWFAGTVGDLATVAPAALGEDGKKSAWFGQPEPPEAVIALVKRDKVAAWQGQPVWQSARGTFEEDEGLKLEVSVIRSAGSTVQLKDGCYWVLNEGAVGTVERVEPVKDRPIVELYVRFKGTPDTAQGWTQKNLKYAQRTQTDVQSETVVKDSYEGVTTTETVRADAKDIGGYAVSGEVGHIFEENGDSFLVKYNTDEILERRRPRVGELVVRGPDWRGGRADGGLQPWGQHPESLAGGTPRYIGKVIDEGEDANSLKVKWIVTGRETAHRFNVSGFYDIQVTPDVMPPKDGDVDRGAAGDSALR